MRRIVSVLLCSAFWLIGPSLGQASDDDEFNRVRRIYIEGAKFRREKRYQDAIPMFTQAFTLLKRAVDKGSKNKRTLRALRKLRFFLGTCHYQVGKPKSSSKTKEDKAFVRTHYKKAVGFLSRFIQETKSNKRRQKSLEILAIAKPWLKANPPPPRPVLRVGPPPKPKPGKLRAWPFIILGVGVAAAIGGTVTAVLTLGKVGERDELHSTLSSSTDPVAKEVARTHKEADSLAMISYILWAAGGAVAVGGLIAVLAAGREAPKKPAKAPPAKTKSLAGSTLLWQGGQP